MLERQFYSLLGPVLCDAFINDLGTCEVPHQLQLPLPHLPQQDPGSAPLGVRTPVPKAFSDKMLSCGAGWVMYKCKASLCLLFPQLIFNQVEEQHLGGKGGQSAAAWCFSTVLVLIPALIPAFFTFLTQDAG